MQTRAGPVLAALVSVNSPEPCVVGSALALLASSIPSGSSTPSISSFAGSLSSMGRALRSLYEERGSRTQHLSRLLPPGSLLKGPSSCSSGRKAHQEALTHRVSTPERLRLLSPFWIEGFLPDPASQRFQNPPVMPRQGPSLFTQWEHK